MGSFNTAATTLGNKVEGNTSNGVGDHVFQNQEKHIKIIIAGSDRDNGSSACLNSFNFYWISNNEEDNIVT